MSIKSLQVRYYVLAVTELYTCSQGLRNAKADSATILDDWLLREEHCKCVPPHIRLKNAQALSRENIPFWQTDGLSIC